MRDFHKSGNAHNDMIIFGWLVRSQLLENVSEDERFPRIVFHSRTTALQVRKPKLKTISPLFTHTHIDKRASERNPDNDHHYFFIPLCS